MKKQACLIIGNVRDGESDGLADAGITVLLLRDKKTVAKLTRAEHVQVVAEYDFNLGYSDQLHALIEKILHEHAVSSVLNFRESYVAITETLCARHPQLSHLHKNIGRTLDKALQRKLYAESGNPDLNVKSGQISIDQLQAGQFGMDFPFILKPANLYSSLFVKCIHKQADLDAYLTNEWPALNRYVEGKTRESNQLIIEEYLCGSNHSIDCAIDCDGNITSFPIVDVITGMEIERHDFHHFARYAPSVITPEMAQRCKELVCDAIKALELRATFAHVEFIMTMNGPRILEMGARPGGSRIYVLREAYGVKLDLAYHQALARLPLEDHARAVTPFGIVTPFAAERRTYRGFFAEQQVSQMKTFRRWYSFVKPGEPIGPVSDGFQNYLYIELNSSSLNDLLQSIYDISHLNIFNEA